MRRFVLAWVLTDALGSDLYFRCYFRAGILGALARYFFFVDELRLRYRIGLVLEERGAVALVGLPPCPYLKVSDLSPLTHWLICLQGKAFADRWTALSNVESSSKMKNVIYLSAIACTKSMRRKSAASQLLSIIRLYARERDLNVTCEVSSSELVAWYKSRGFVVTGESQLPNGCPVLQLKAFNSMD